MLAIRIVVCRAWPAREILRDEAAPAPLFLQFLENILDIPLTLPLII